MRGGYILVVDDEASICELIKTALEMADFQVRLAANGLFAQQMIQKEPPLLVIMDWMMPMMSGIELTYALKRDVRTADIPVILLTARNDEEDRIQGLEAGADDYVSKPFSPRELVARVRAVLRRTTSAMENELLVVSVLGLKLNRQSQQVTIDDALINLGPLEFRLLEFLMTHPERVYSRTQLLDQVWGNNVYIDERTVDVHIRRLRKTLSVKNYDALIQTVRGTGYRFSQHVTIQS